MFPPRVRKEDTTKIGRFMIRSLSFLRFNKGLSSKDFIRAQDSALAGISLLSR